jgi:hypothetical protein
LLIGLVRLFYLSSDSWVTSLWQAQLNVHQKNQRKP